MAEELVETRFTLSFHSYITEEYQEAPDQGELEERAKQFMKNFNQNIQQLDLISR